MCATTISSPIESISSENKNTSVKCPKCNSIKLRKKGLRKTQNRGKQQRFLCNGCNHSFTQDKGFWKMKNNENKICQAIDTYYEGLSLRKVRRNFYKYAETKISHQSVLNWIRKYAYIMRKFVETLKPELDGHFLTDETMIKCSGKYHNFGMVLDKKTRYVVATRYTENETIKVEDNIVLWREATRIKSPYRLTSDSHMTYKEAFQKVFYSRYKVERIEWEKINVMRTGKYNYLMERIWNTLKERIKIMRGFKASWSAKLLLDGFFIWYNNCRPHMTFYGTPAMNAGLNEMTIRGMIESAAIYNY
jgi:transposase-like protein